MRTAAPDLVQVWPLLRVHLWLCSSNHRAKNTGPPVEVPPKGMEQPFPRLRSLTTKTSTHMYQQKASNQPTLYSVHQVKDTCLRVSGSVIHNTLTVYESVKQVLLGLQGWTLSSTLLTVEAFTLDWKKSLSLPLEDFLCKTKTRSGGPGPG